ncbi:unnamed protein product [Rangifer tarandus platyrhynchus]|uniref:Uncharacterized protein n=1 Tax=Rangifer tarandus platyrhynchus TaxID=3082113 RepID=A0AC59YD31_RANTA
MGYPEAEADGTAASALTDVNRAVLARTLGKHCEQVTQEDRKEPQLWTRLSERRAVGRGVCEIRTTYPVTGGWCSRHRRPLPGGSGGGVQAEGLEDVGKGHQLGPGDEERSRVEGFHKEPMAMREAPSRNCLPVSSSTGDTCPLGCSS